MRKELLALALFGSALTAAPAPAPAVVPAGTFVHVRLSQSLDTRRDRPGTPFVAHLAAPVVYNGEVILERGALCRGHVVESRSSGRLKGRAVMRLSLDSIESHGRRYSLVTTDPAFA